MSTSSTQNPPEPPPIQAPAAVESPPISRAPACPVEPPPIVFPPACPVEPPPIVLPPACPVEPPPIPVVAAAAHADPGSLSDGTPRWLVAIVFAELLVAGFAAGGIAAVLVRVREPWLEIGVLLPEEISEHGTLRLVIPAQHSGYSPDQITYGARNAPAGLSVDKQTGVVTWTPSELQGPGTYRIQLQAFAAGPKPQAAQRELVVRVAEVYDPPIIAPIADHTIRDDGTLDLQIEAVDPDAEHADCPNAPLRYRVFSVGEWVVPCKIDRDSGVFRFEPDPGPDRTYTFEVWVEKEWPKRAVAKRTFHVHVKSTAQ